MMAAVNSGLEWVNANSGAVIALLTLTYCVTTALILFANVLTIREMRLTRQAQYRPLVVVDLESNSERGAYHFVLRNAGASVARNVTVKIDPPLTNPVNPQLTDEGSLRWIRRGLPVVAPGKEHRMLLGSWGNFSKDTARQYQVAVSYRNDTGRRGYSDTFTLDFDALPGRPSDPKSVHSVAEAIDKLNTSISQLIVVLSRRDTPNVSPE